MKSITPRHRDLESKKLKDKKWTEEYVAKSYLKFESSFNDLYENVIADKIFKNHATFVTREQFIINIAGEKKVSLNKMMTWAGDIKFPKKLGNQP
mmetsp:Transcript_23158/g.35862  ORF Transcript_23158/g.35862 Transcript_23158/m.35862 type:complete len:95 (+) Transcript_23158:890-1174(+)